MFPRDRITELREEMGITQAELSDNVHVSGSSVSEYEKGVSHS